jgi:hypothetical protein
MTTARAPLEAGSQCFTGQRDIERSHAAHSLRAWYNDSQGWRDRDLCARVTALAKTLGIHWSQR